MKMHAVDCASLRKFIQKCGLVYGNNGGSKKFVLDKTKNSLPYEFEFSTHRFANAFYVKTRVPEGTFCEFYIKTSGDLKGHFVLIDVYKREDEEDGGMSLTLDDLDTAYKVAQALNIAMAQYSAGKWKT